MTDVKHPAEIVEALFADLRDRRFLKWLFKEEEGLIGDFIGLRSLDLAVQQEIRQAWVEIISTATEEHASLIAAAPDLLEALKGMRAEWDKLTRYGSPMAKAANEAVQAMDAAIAKASGETP